MIVVTGAGVVVVKLRFVAFRRAAAAAASADSMFGHMQVIPGLTLEFFWCFFTPSLTIERWK